MVDDLADHLGDVPAATAILDRFLSRAQILQLQGKSYRLHQQRVKQTEHAGARRDGDAVSVEFTDITGRLVAYSAVRPIGFIHEGMLESTRERKHTPDG